MNRFIKLTLLKNNLKCLIQVERILDIDDQGDHREVFIDKRYGAYHSSSEVKETIEEIEKLINKGIT